MFASAVSGSQHHESTDIDSINPQNVTFNKKLKRQYDKVLYMIFDLTCFNVL